MFGEEKNLKDTTQNSLKDTHSLPVSYDSKTLCIGSYSKSDKLITALYMVTDIIDKDDPLRIKLRSLAVSLLSDIYLLSRKIEVVFEIDRKINEILSFLSMGSSVGIISEMNAGILRKEFFELKKAVSEYSESNTKWLEEILSVKEDEKQILPDTQTKSQNQLKGHSTPNNVQKKIVKDTETRIKDMEEVKNKRRAEILKIVIENKDGATITDIRSKNSSILASCGEKTLQRELVSMVKDGVLKKDGEKRWSRYSLA
ncbi:MAG: hypothetical protein WCX79_04615 [Candidatus Paceibacterota bacterium]|jgi:hypothetical protein